ncbi:hypothetical protein [Rhodococcoides navarretei]|uniref:Uncharacterized protein n=1 Tax=Rhodococcus navarretei TaxID=3128981 RepID=A0ABU9D1F7_9NOCA
MPVRKKPDKVAEQPDRPREPTLGDRVRIVGPDGPDDIGTLIEDYAEFTVEGKEMNRTWAPMRRWAIALNSGTLAFADDVEIHVAEESPGST